MAEGKSETTGTTRRQFLVAAALTGGGGIAALLGWQASETGKKYDEQFAEKVLPPEVLKVIPEVTGVSTTETLKISTAIPTWVFNYIPLLSIEITS